MDDLVSKLSEIRSQYNCFDEDEEPKYRALSEAIRILSQCADGDTISRQAAIDALCEEPVMWPENDDYGQGLNNQWHYDVNALKAVPSAQRWIPCSERLPDESKWYLISNGLDSWVAIWSKENKEWLSVTGFDYTIADVIAWMEFPEAYKPPKEKT